MRLIKQQLRRFLRACGIEVFRLGSCPRGVLFTRDLADLLVGVAQPAFLDVGANTGQTTTRLLEWFPSATIHAFEPVRSTYRTLVENVGSCPGVTVHNVAVADYEGTSLISAVPNSGLNRLLPSDSSDGEVEETKVVTLDAWAASSGMEHIDLLKTDCEGFDLQALLGAHRLLKDGKVMAVICEVNMARNGKHGNFYAIDEFLTACGFSFYAFYDYSARPFIFGDGFMNGFWVHRQGGNTR